MKFAQPFLPLTPDARASSLRRAVGTREGPIWVFAYGSLIWNPGFAVADRKLACLRGFRRSFCIWSTLARGSPDRPGLGLGLTRIASSTCEGVALKIDRADRKAALASLWEREMWTDAYTPTWQILETEDAPLEALVFVSNPDSPQFAGNLSREAAAQYIRTASGKFGTCRDYLEMTDDSLQKAGISCPEVAAIRRLV